MTRLVEPNHAAQSALVRAHRLLAWSATAVLALSCAGLTASLAAAGCAAGDDVSKDPSKAAAGKRDTEMEHEDCDLESSSARSLDANRDGHADIITVMDGNAPRCRAADINMDKVIDVFVYYDKSGKQRRRESGFDRDMRPDEVSIFNGGVLVRKERETNNDGKLDTWDYYQGGRLVREERDSTGDGYVDQWWTFNRPGKPRCALVISDEDGDGKPEKDSQIDRCADAGAAAARSSAAPSASASADASASAAEPELPSPTTAGGAPPSSDEEQP